MPGIRSTPARQMHGITLPCHLQAISLSSQVDASIRNRYISIHWRQRRGNQRGKAKWTQVHERHFEVQAECRQECRTRCQRPFYRQLCSAATSAYTRWVSHIRWRASRWHWFLTAVFDLLKTSSHLTLSLFVYIVCVCPSRVQLFQSHSLSEASNWSE